MKNFESWIKKRTGTSFRGYLHASYRDLEYLFGSPVENPDSHKTDAEWIIDTPYGIATIYNYKNGKSYLANKGLETTTIVEWHIGGKDDRVTAYLKTKIDNHIIRRLG